MPTRKKPRKSKAEQREVSVTLTEKDRIEFGRTLLGIKDGPRRNAALAEFEPMLGKCASVLANVGRMDLPSDHIAATRPLVLAAERLENKLRTGNRDVLLLMHHFKFIDYPTLLDQLTGMRRYMAWLKSYPSKRGGERRAYAKHERQSQLRIFENWFGRHHKRSDPDNVPKARKKFAKKAVKVVECALREAAFSSSNTGKK